MMKWRFTDDHIIALLRGTAGSQQFLADEECLRGETETETSDGSQAA
jgi:hypothetical protein